MNVNRINQINGYHCNNQIKKQNMKLLEQKRVVDTGANGYQSHRGREQGRRGAPALGPTEGERTPEHTAGTRAAGEGAGMSGRTSTGAGGGRADTEAHGGY